ncbi:MAG: hypothetical protein LBS35_08515, partial [Synergistaceae bacterium]|nr:hypothetical protein [Synergistaceae bacterium]
KSRREQYLKALDQADQSNYAALAAIIAKAVIDNVHRFIVPKFAQNSDWVRLESLVAEDMTYQTLRQAVNRGKLEGKIGDDGYWYSTPEALSEYRKNRYKRS